MPLPVPLLFPKSQKGLKILMAVLFIICLGASVLVYVFWTADQSQLKEYGQPDFNTLSQDELKDGLIVKGDIDLVLDVYAEEYETNLGTRTDEDSETLYYVVPVHHEDDAGYIIFDYILTYEAGSADFKTMDSILEETWSEQGGQTVLSVENARIQSLPGEIKGYFTEWYENPEFYEGGSFIDWAVETETFETSDRALIASKLTPYMVDRTDTAGTDPVIAWIFLGFAIVCLIILLALIFRKGPQQPPQPQYDDIR